MYGKQAWLDLVSEFPFPARERAYRLATVDGLVKFRQQAINLNRIGTGMSPDDTFAKLPEVCLGSYTKMLGGKNL
jgi:hypothetical protein